MKNYVFLIVGLVVALFSFTSLASACWFGSYPIDNQTGGSYLIGSGMMGPWFSGLFPLMFLFMTLFGFLVILLLLLSVAALAKWLIDGKKIEKRTVDKENKVL